MPISDHPKYPQLLTFTAAFVESVRIKQAEYYITHGRYFQGLKTPVVAPDGNTNEKVGHGLKPHDQPESWNDFDAARFNNSTRVPYSIELNTYSGPSGDGWILRGELRIAGFGPDAYGTDGDTWVYQHNEGPDARSGV